MANDLFQPVNWIGGYEPNNDPAYLPNRPHNIPLAGDLMRRGGSAQLLGAEPPTTGLAPGPSETIRDPHHYANLISFKSTAPNLTLGAASIKVLETPNVKRNWLSFRNSSATANIYIDFGKNASTDSWLYLTPNQIVLFDVVVPQDDVWIGADDASGFLSLAWSTLLG